MRRKDSSTKLGKVQMDNDSSRDVFAIQSLTVRTSVVNQPKKQILLMCWTRHEKCWLKKMIRQIFSLKRNDSISIED